MARNQIFKRLSDGRKVEVRPVDYWKRGRQWANSLPGLHYVAARPIGNKTWATWESNAFLRYHVHPKGNPLITGAAAPSRSPDVG